MSWSHMQSWEILMRIGWGMFRAKYLPSFNDRQHFLWKYLIFVICNLPYLSVEHVLDWDIVLEIQSCRVVTTVVNNLNTIRNNNYKLRQHFQDGWRDLALPIQSSFQCLCIGLAITFMLKWFRATLIFKDGKENGRMCSPDPHLPIYWIGVHIKNMGI